MRKLTYIFSFLLLLTFGSAFASTSITQMIVFGDSLSDNGNLFHATEELHKIIPLIPVVPLPETMINGKETPVYWDGRFSNGPVWDEDLAKMLNLSESNPAQYQNYAFGGAWAEVPAISHEPFPPSINAQITKYLKTDPTNLSHTLFTVWGGANDYIHGRHFPNIDTTLTVDALRDEIQRLINAGGKYFIVPNLPNLGDTPEAYNKGYQYQELMSEFSKLHDQKLAAMLQQLQAKNPSVVIMPLDVSQLFNSVQIDPSYYAKKYDLLYTSPADPCYQGPFTMTQNGTQEKAPGTAAEINNTQPKYLKMLSTLLNNGSTSAAYNVAQGLQSGQASLCTDPNQHLFFGHLHPTAEVHEIIAQQAYQALVNYHLATPITNAVPAGV